MIELADLLRKEGIDPGSVSVARHRPKERELRRILPWIAANQRKSFEAYQAAQGPAKTAILVRRDYLASFIGLDNGATVFVGLYERRGQRRITPAEYRAKPEVELLLQARLRSFYDDEDTWFDLDRVGAFEQLHGRLVIDWGSGHLAWIQKIKPGKFPIRMISDENLLTGRMDPWDEIDLSHAELATLPMAWRERMSQWRGVYIITDMKDGARYVGSASGADNILQRWEHYASSGSGGNLGLKDRNPGSFRFSILQLTAPDTTAADTIALESKWKSRLHTRRFGLNRN